MSCAAGLFAGCRQTGESGEFNSHSVALMRMAASG
jgi:hypothetical protein